MTRFSCSIAFLVVFVMSTVSCSILITEKALFYEYESEIYEAKLGSFRIAFEPTQSWEETAEGAREIWRNPYRWNSQYYPLNGTVGYGVLTNLSITSVESGLEVTSADIIKNTIGRNYQGTDDTPKPMLAFGSTINVMPHEDMLVNFDFAIYRDTNTVLETGSVSVRINANFYESRNRRGVGVL